ncbi:MAG: hypothetical protein HQK79_00980 [Desulfobacterales bacterium]|nr:hypothetical protein [Desulfobacterales bacterium]
MTNQRTISSTDKLLNVIRDKKSPLKTNPYTKSPLVSSPGEDSSIKSFFSRRKSTIGVVVGYNDIKLVKIAQAVGKKRELLDYMSLPMEGEPSKDSPQFIRLLKSALIEFIGTNKDFEIWTTVSSSKVEMRYLRIPKVPKKEISNAVFWMYKKEVPFKENEVIFDYDLLGETVDGGMEKYEIMAYTAPRDEVKEAKEIFAKAGVPLTGVSVVPFAIQNLMRTHWIDNRGTNTCNLYVGRGYSRIDIFAGENLMLSRGIKAGINSMIESIRESMDEVIGKSETGESSISKDQAAKIFFSLIEGSNLAKNDIGYGLKDHQIFEMVKPALDRLVGQVERTLKHFSLKFRDEAVAKIFVSGPISTYSSIVEHFGEQLGISSDTFREGVDPLAEAELSFLGEAQGRIVSYRRKIEEIGERLTLQTFREKAKELEAELPFLGEAKKVASIKEALVPAIGIALSDNNTTPNFLYTYKDKEKLNRNKQISQILLVLCSIIMAICFGFSLWQGHLIANKKAELANLEKDLSTYSPKMNQMEIMGLVSQLKKKRDLIVESAKRYNSMAFISEIADLTPPEIRLKNIDIEMPFVPPAEEKKQPVEGQPVTPDVKPVKPKYLKVEGIISGDRLTLETAFTGYLVKLKDSPLFGEVVEKEVKYQPDPNDKTKEVLQFSAKLEIN